MAKARNARRRAAIQPTEALDGPTPEQVAKGGYSREEFIHADDAKRVTAYVNRGGTPVARWKLSGRLSDTQVAAIDHCIRLWAITDSSPRLTAQYGERTARSADVESAIARQVDARNDLWRIIDYFPGPLRLWWGVFENVCRHDMPAGVAGAELGFGDRTGDARAHTVVCFVADIIAQNERL